MQSRGEERKSGAPPFCLREACCGASASLDADISVLSVSQEAAEEARHRGCPLPPTRDMIVVTNKAENRLCGRDPVFLGLCCLPELPAGTYL